MRVMRSTLSRKAQPNYRTNVARECEVYHVKRGGMVSAHRSLSVESKRSADVVTISPAPGANGLAIAS